MLQKYFFDKNELTFPLSNEGLNHQSLASYHSTNLIETFHSYADIFARLYKMATIFVVLHCSVHVETVGQGHIAWYEIPVASSVVTAISGCPLY